MTAEDNTQREVDTLSRLPRVANAVAFIVDLLDSFADGKYLHVHRSYTYCLMRVTFIQNYAFHHKTNENSLS